MSGYANSEVLLSELTEINRAIDEVTHVLKTFAKKRDSIFEALDAVTKPAIQLVPSARVVYRGYVFNGHFTNAWYLSDLYCWLLNQVLTDYPDKADAIANAMSRHGTNRNYLAREAEQLFTGKSLGWVKKYSKKLRSGWYVDTNINRERMQTLLPIAMRAAGLEWGKDVRVFWSRTTITENEARMLGI